MCLMVKIEQGDVEKGVINANFKGFMAKNVQAKLNIIQIMYDNGDPNEPMVNREGTCYFHYTQSMDIHTKQQIKLEMCEQHKTLCYEYKNATSLEEANVCYVIIYCWWYSLGVHMQLGFKSWTIGSVSNTFVSNNGKVL